MDINNKTQQINTFSKGMNTDVSDSLIPADQYRYAENLRFIANGNPNTGELTLIEGQDFYATLGSRIDHVVASAAVRQYMIFLGNREYYIYGELDHTDGCIIVFNTEDSSFNRVACIDGGWNASNYSLVTRWESDRNVKLYIADGIHELMSLNIIVPADTYTSFDLLTGSSAQNTAIINYEIVDGGHIKNPVIQYAYVLYNTNGYHSDISTTTPIIKMYNDNVGFDGKSSTNKAVFITIDVTKGNYSNIYLFRLEYDKAYNVPTVYLVCDEELDDESSFTYTDAGDYISTYSISEFLSLLKYYIKPAIIESKNDYLFAAKITDGVAEVDSLFDNIHPTWEIVSKLYRIDLYGNFPSGDDAYGPSLMSGEVYRYGIVYYTKDGKRSSVHYFGQDVPVEETRSIIDHISYDSTSNKYIYTINRYGIKVTMPQLPPECAGYEVVRCERTINDSTTLFQGIVGATNGKDNENFRYGSIYMTLQDISHDLISSKTDLVMFASPESSYQMDDCVNVLDQYANSIRLKKVQEYDINPSYGKYTADSYARYSYLQSYDDWYSQENQNSGEVGPLVIRWGGVVDEPFHIMCDVVDNFAETEDNNKMTICHRYLCSTSRTDTTKNQAPALIKGYSSIYSPSPYDFDDNGEFTIGKNSTVVDTIDFLNWDAYCFCSDGKLNTTDPKYHVNPLKDCISSETDDWPTGFRKWILISSGKKCLLFKTDLEKIDVDRVSLDYTPYPPQLNEIYCKIQGLTPITVMNVEKTGVIPYGGKSETALHNNTYYCYDKFHNSLEQEIYVYDGDVYNCVFIYNSSHAFISSKYAAKSHPIIYAVPLSSRIDLHARYGYLYPDFINDPYKRYFLDTSGSYRQFYQPRDAYMYSTSYNIGAACIPYSMQKKRDTDVNTHDTRIHYSDIKTNGELIDSWTNFKAMNFLDVDTRYGEITGLRLFKNALVYWLKGATGILSVNERTMILDANNSNIILGNGDVLQRYDYLSTTYGMMPNQQCDALSDTTLYWWDGYNKDIVAYAGGQQIMPMKITKQVSNYIDNGEAILHPVIAYDNKYKELIANVVSPHPIVYSEIIQQFTSVYTIEFDHRINVDNRLYLINGVGINLWNAGNQEDTKPILKYVVNDNSTVVKTFDNVQFGASGIEDVNNINFEFTTPLGQSSSFIAEDNAITDREGDFRFAIPRDNGAEYGGRMRGKTLACTLSIEEGFESKNLSIQYIITKYRISWS